MKKYELPRYDYPNKYDQHMIKVKKIAELPKMDENYPFIDRSKKFCFMRAMIYALINTFAYLVCKIRFGFKIYGRKLLKENEEILKNGAITICNHVLMWDYILILLAIRPHQQHHAAWLNNLSGPNRHLIRLVGGVPIPANFSAMKKFNAEIDNSIAAGEWFHVFPEGSMWYYYDKIRPFKKGAFTYAVRHNKPIVPLVISYRKRRGIASLFTKKPAIDVHICEPILPNTSLEKGAANFELLTKCRTAMQKTSGFKESIDQKDEYRICETGI